MDKAAGEVGIVDPSRLPRTDASFDESADGGLDSIAGGGGVFVPTAGGAVATGGHRHSEVTVRKPAVKAPTPELRDGNVWSGLEALGMLASVGLDVRGFAIVHEWYASAERAYREDKEVQPHGPRHKALLTIERLLVTYKYMVTPKHSSKTAVAAAGTAGGGGQYASLNLSGGASSGSAAAGPAGGLYAEDYRLMLAQTTNSSGGGAQGGGAQGGRGGGKGKGGYGKGAGASSEVSNGGNSGGGVNLKLSLWCLNPAVAFAEMASQTHSVILTSGTLTPLESFKTELGVDFRHVLSTRHVIDTRAQLWAAPVAFSVRPQSMTLRLDTGAAREILRRRTHGEPVGASVVPFPWRLRPHPGATPPDCALRGISEIASTPDYCDLVGMALLSAVASTPGGVLVFFQSAAMVERVVKRWKEARITLEEVLPHQPGAPPGSGRQVTSRTVSLWHAIWRVKRIFTEPRESGEEFTGMLKEFRRTVDATAGHAGHALTPEALDGPDRPQQHGGGGAPRGWGTQEDPSEYENDDDDDEDEEEGAGVPAGDRSSASVFSALGGAGLSNPLYDDDEDEEMGDGADGAARAGSPVIIDLDEDSTASSSGLIGAAAAAAPPPAKVQRTGSAQQARRSAPTAAAVASSADPSEPIRAPGEPPRTLSQSAADDPHCTGAVLLAYCRGKASEGIDFADEYARAVLCVSVPLANPFDPQVSLKKDSQSRAAERAVKAAQAAQLAASRHAEARRQEAVRAETLQARLAALGSDADHELAAPAAQSVPATSSAPAASHPIPLTGDKWYQQSAFRALNQALGRCIRHKDDYGAVILLDQRFAEEANIGMLSAWARERVAGMRELAGPAAGPARQGIRVHRMFGELTNFFQERAKHHTQPRPPQPASAPAEVSSTAVPRLPPQRLPAVSPARPMKAEADIGPAEQRAPRTAPSVATTASQPVAAKAAQPVAAPVQLPPPVSKPASRPKPASPAPQHPKLASPTPRQSKPASPAQHRTFSTIAAAHAPPRQGPRPPAPSSIPADAAASAASRLAAVCAGVKPVVSSAQAHSSAALSQQGQHASAMPALPLPSVSRPQASNIRGGASGSVGVQARGTPAAVRATLASAQVGSASSFPSSASSASARLGPSDDEGESVASKRAGAASAAVASASAAAQAGAAPAFDSDLDCDNLIVEEFDTVEECDEAAAREAARYSSQASAAREAASFSSQPSAAAASSQPQRHAPQYTASQPRSQFTVSLSSARPASSLPSAQYARPMTQESRMVSAADAHRAVAAHLPRSQRAPSAAEVLVQQRNGAHHAVANRAPVARPPSVAAPRPTVAPTASVNVQSYFPPGGAAANAARAPLPYGYPRPILLAPPTAPLAPPAPYRAAGTAATSAATVHLGYRPR